MANATAHTFTHEELLAILLKNAGIHEGLWMLSINFGLSATNMSPTTSAEENLRPCVMATVESFGLLQVERTLKGLTLDAGVVNPLKKPASKKKALPR